MANPLQRKKRLALLNKMREKKEKVVENTLDMVSDAIEVVKEEVKELILPKEEVKQEKEPTKEEIKVVETPKVEEEEPKTTKITTVRKISLKEGE